MHCHCIMAIAWDVTLLDFTHRTTYHIRFLCICSICGEKSLTKLFWSKPRHNPECEVEPDQSHHLEEAPDLSHSLENVLEPCCLLQGGKASGKRHKAENLV